nr:hypothetical protein [uncultured Azospirillum sp.]
MDKSLKPYFEKANQRLGLLDPAAIDWIVEIAEPLEEQGQSFEAIARMVRGAGEPVDKAVKIAAGLNVRLVLGTRFWSALSDKGRPDPDAAILRTLHRAVFDRRQDAHIADAERRGWPLRVSVVDDGRTCAAAVKLHGQAFPAEKAPRFPLARCRKPLCRCMHIAMPSLK